MRSRLLLRVHCEGPRRGGPVPTANPKRLANTSESAEARPVMRGFWRLIWDALTGLVRSQAALQAEIIVLRHQLNVLRRKSPKRLVFTGTDRLVFVALMVKRRRPPSQGWKTFLRNHADGIASMDLFVVPTISFRLLYGFLILRHCRRKLLWLGVTAHPSAEWIARQLTEACGWREAPRYIVRDRDGAYGEVFTRRLRAMGIRYRPISARSPWQNGCAERLIGSIRRDCLDHVLAFGERHLRHLLKSYQSYYNEARTHLSLQKDAPISRAVEAYGRPLAIPVLGGLHHRYVRH